jgi:hypothetical protein
MINCQEADIASSPAPNREGNYFGLWPLPKLTSLPRVTPGDLISPAAGPDFRPDALSWIYKGGNPPAQAQSGTVARRPKNQLAKLF